MQPRKSPAFFGLPVIIYLLRRNADDNSDNHDTSRVQSNLQGGIDQINKVFLFSNVFLLTFKFLPSIFCNKRCNYQVAWGSAKNGTGNRGSFQHKTGELTVKNRILVCAAALMVSLAARATTITWDYTTQTLSNAIQSVWVTPGDHTVVLPQGYYEGAYLGTAVSGNIVFENFLADSLGARQCDSLVIQGAGAGYVDDAGSGGGTFAISGTILMASSDKDGNGAIRINATDMTNVTFKDLTLMVRGGQALFGQWQNSGMCDITMDSANIMLAESSVLMGRFTVYDNDPLANWNGNPGTINFTNGAVLGMTGTALIRDWDANSGIPGPGLLYFDETSQPMDWNTAYSQNFFVNFPGNVFYYQRATNESLLSKTYTAGAGNLPAALGGGSVLTVQEIADYYGTELGIFDGPGVIAEVVIPEPSALALLGLAGTVLSLRRRRS